MHIKQTTNTIKSMALCLSEVVSQIRSLSTLRNIRITTESCLSAIFLLIGFTENEGKELSK